MFAVVTSGLFLPSHHAWRREPLAAGRIAALLAAAERLRTSARDGTMGQPLRGKNLALLPGPAGASFAALREAAQELGMRVAELRFTKADKAVSRRDDLLAAARMLGRLYDAVDGGALASATVRRIGREAGVPVYDGLCLDEHPARAAADLMMLREHPSHPIRFLGDPNSARGRFFVAAARELGFELRMGEGVSLDDGDVPFVVDARHSPRWSLSAGGHLLDEGRRTENHRRVMQVVLLDTMLEA